MSDNLTALVEGSSKSILVGLFSSHANELGKVHRHLSNVSTGNLPLTPQSSKRKSQPRLSDQKASQIVAAYEAGKTVNELATFYSCHRVTVSAVLHRKGVALRFTSPTPEQIHEMVHFYQSGLSLAKVGERFGFNPSTVLTQLRKAGVVTRDAHGRVR